MELQAKRILLTGADGGIGTALSRELAAAGANLVLCSQKSASLEKLKSELPSSTSGAAHHCIAADVSCRDDRRRMVEQCERLGGIDILINLAGVLDFQWFENQPGNVVEKTISINLLAPMLLCQEFIPQLKAKKEAIILNVGSIFGSIGHPGFVAYCASKAGMKTFTEALARELSDTSISLSYIAPRATVTALNTDRINALNKALGNRMDTPDFVAQQIVMQLQDGRRLTYLGWPEKIFVRLNALLPSVVHKALVKNLGLIKQYASS